MATFETPHPIALIVELAIGDVRIEASDRPDTVVEVHPSDSSKRADVIAAEQTQVEYSGGRLLLKSARTWRSYSPFGYGGGIEVRVGLPSGSQVSGDAAMGAFRCSGSLGDCLIKTALGDIAIERAAVIKLKASAGDISVERAVGDAELSTSSGAVRVGEIDGSAVIKNSNGESRVGEVTGELWIKAANGEIAVERAHGSITAKTANGDIRIGAVERGPVVAETAYGDVEVGIPDGVAAWLDLRTGYGHLNNALDATERPGPNDDSVEVRARSGYGDITVRHPYPGS